MKLTVKPAMKPNFKNTSVVLLAVLLCLGFQNCSKVQFAATDGSLIGKAGGQGDGLDDVNFPEDEDLDEELVDNDDDDDGVDNLDDVDGSACELYSTAVIDGGVRGVDVKIHKFRGDLVIAESQTLDLTNIRGSVYAKTVDATHLRNIRGGLCLVGETLGKLNNHRGNIEIIGAATESINNTRGTMVINGGSIASIHNHRGSIIFKNGATLLGEISNHRGEIIGIDQVVAGP